MANKRFDDAMGTVRSNDRPTYQVLDAAPARPAPTAGVGDLLALALGAGLLIFLAVVALALGGGRPVGDAVRIAAIVAAVAVIVFVLLAVLTYLGVVGNLIDHLLLASLERRRIDGEVRVRLAEIRMRRAVSLAQAAIEAQRGEVARAALAETTKIPLALTDRDETEEAIVQAVLKAYQMADGDGLLGGAGASPFSKRAVGERVYPVLLERLRNPGTRWGVHGSPSIAYYDEATKRWRLNLREYPTPDRALAALTGR
jgi:hypothetical protein